MKSIRLVFTIIITFLITACSSVPLSTMVHFSDAKPEDFFQVDPRGITVKVTINTEANFDPIVSVKLSAMIEDETGKINFIFPLERISMHKQPAENGYFSSRPAFDIYILRLSVRAIKNLELINLERQSGQKKKVALSAGVDFSKDINVIDEDTVLSIGLKLTEQDNFIMLIDNWKVQDAH